MHQSANAPKTAGRVNHSHARRYDLFGRVISLGRDKAIREKLIELAAPAPGEKMLVYCRSNSLTKDGYRCMLAA
jgi:ubiquinone/menaquinone biosynthesis C-methylase UbiE